MTDEFSDSNFKLQNEPLSFQYHCKPMQILPLRELRILIRCCWPLGAHPFVVNHICSFGESCEVRRQLAFTSESALIASYCIKGVQTEAALLSEGRSVNLSTHKHLQAILRPDSVFVVVCPSPPPENCCCLPMPQSLFPVQVLSHPK